MVAKQVLFKSTSLRTRTSYLLLNSSILWNFLTKISKLNKKTFTIFSKSSLRFYSDFKCATIIRNMKLKYIADQKYDALMIYQILSSKNGIVDLKYQSENMNLDFETVKKISEAENYESIKSKIEEIVKNRYLTSEGYLNLSIGMYQKSWDEINDTFFSRLSEITKFPIQHKTFECVLSDFHIGISNWGGNKIVRSWKENPFTQRRITAHEIIISHFFSYIYEKYPEIKDRHKIWELAEIFTFVITGTDEVMTKFWPWDKSGSYTDHNYPELVKKQKALTKIYLNDGFQQFIKVGLE